MPVIRMAGELRAAFHFDETSSGALIYHRIDAMRCDAMRCPEDLSRTNTTVDPSLESHSLSLVDVLPLPTILNF